jgi:type II secretory pathway component GspD/PulD (secretin)
MKRQISIGFLLLTIFCVTSVSAQTSIVDKRPLVTKFIKVNALDLPKQKCESDNCFWESETEAEKFFQLFRTLLSSRSSIELDYRSKILIISDSQGRAKLITEFVKILDETKLISKDLVFNNSDKIGNYSLKIKLENLQFTTRCGTGNERVTWQQEQALMLLSIIRKFLSPDGSFEIDGREKTVTITDNEKRIEVMKQIAELFDKPFLEEEFKIN